MIIPAPNDIAFYVSSFPVYWYGIFMAAAIFVSIVVANSFFNRINPFCKKDIIIESGALIIFLGILCARLYFCALNFGYYSVHPLEILDIRQGGLSIHGAIFGGILSIFIVSLKTKIPMMRILDSLSCTTILGQAIGRWGNYFNSEAYGFPTKSQTWGLYIAPEKRIGEYSSFDLFHPTFFYESVLDFAAFLILTFILFKYGKKYCGLTFFSYLAFYAMIRVFVENIRIDSALNIGSVPVAQIVSIVMFAAAIIGICTVLFKSRKN